MKVHALERALPDLPDHDALRPKCEEVELPEEMIQAYRLVGWIGPNQTTMVLLPADACVTPFELFSGPWKLELKEFIAFCRQGGFRIA